MLKDKKREAELDARLRAILIQEDEDKKNGAIEPSPEEYYKAAMIQPKGLFTWFDFNYAYDAEGLDALVREMNDFARALNIVKDSISNKKKGNLQEFLQLREYYSYLTDSYHKLITTEDIEKKNLLKKEIKEFIKLLNVGLFFSETGYLSKAENQKYFFSKSRTPRTPASEK